MKTINYGKQFITEKDIKSVVESLRGDYLTQGPAIYEFEQKFANYIGSKYAVAVSNGTAALHLSALSLGLKPGDKVITSPITFAATANCLRYCGAEVVFCDIDEDTFLLDINKVEKLLQSSPRGTYKGIITVDFAGMPVNSEEFHLLAKKYDCFIIEDACHAPGAWYRDSKGAHQNSGNGIYADTSIFSFHPVKHIATGEGGMVTTNNRELYERMLILRTHGITRNEASFINDLYLASGTMNHGGKYPGWYMEMQELGFNFRLTDFQAALGISQLDNAAMGIEKRENIAKNYDLAFRDIDDIKCPQIQKRSNQDNLFLHAFHLYVIKTSRRLELYNYLKERNIITQVHYIPLHLMPYYRNFGWNIGDFPVAENYYKNCLSLPIYPSLSSDEQDYVIREIKNFFNQ
jgi:UDP-4-amino-4,6-dideoxy-N-acetyl-beta-L-altrosamine transaminase